METEGNSLELPPLEKLTLASSKTQGEAAPDHGQDLERKEQEGENVSEVSGTDGKTDGNDQVTESSNNKPGASVSNSAAQKKERVSSLETDQQWACGINPEIVREMLMAGSSVQQPPVHCAVCRIPNAYAVRPPHTPAFRSSSYGRNGSGRRNYYDHEDSYEDVDDRSLSVHDIHDFDSDTDTVCD